MSIMSLTIFDFTMPWFTFVLMCVCLCVCVSHQSSNVIPIPTQSHIHIPIELAARHLSRIIRYDSRERAHEMLQDAAMEKYAKVLLRELKSRGGLVRNSTQSYLVLHIYIFVNVCLNIKQHYIYTFYIIL
jgi:hypothetical protein